MRPLRSSGGAMLSRGLRTDRRRSRRRVDRRRDAHRTTAVHRMSRSSTFDARHDRSRSTRPGARVVPGERSRGRDLCFFVWPTDRRGDDSAMFVVMAAGASEAEVLGVKSRILAEGLTPFDHPGPSASSSRSSARSAAASRRCSSRFAALPGVERVTPITRPFKLDVARVPPRGHGHPRPRRGDRRRLADGHGRALLGREPRPAVRDRRRRRGRRARPSSAAAPSSRGRARTPSRASASRRCATWPRPASGPGCRSSPRSWSRRRSTSSPSTPTSSRSAPGTCRTTRCCGTWAGRPAGHAQARLRRHDRGVADGRRVHRQLGQPERDPLRARHPDVRDVYPQHAWTSPPCRCSIT